MDPLRDWVVWKAAQLGSVSELARRSGVSQSSLSRFVREQGDLSRASIQLLANAFPEDCQFIQAAAISCPSNAA